VQDVAPDELPQFPMVAQVYLAASETQWERAMRQAEPLGLGLVIQASLSANLVAFRPHAFDPWSGFRPGRTSGGR
jgi:hypothetical protein